MRRGELLGLRWTDIDLARSRLSVRQTLVAVGYEAVISTPKSHQARVIDLDTGTVAQLRQHHERQDEERAQYGEAYLDTGLAFRASDGRALHPHSFITAFQRLVLESGLPRIRLHDLRHSHATIALAAGVPVKVISERLGHESPAFTQRQYLHVLPSMQVEAANAVAEEVWGPGRLQPQPTD
jgi:integrase